MTKVLRAIYHLLEMLVSGQESESEEWSEILNAQLKDVRKAIDEWGGVMDSREGTMVGDPAVSFALDQLKKDELNDLVHGLAMERLGPGAHEPDVFSLLQEWADGLALVRGEVLPSIAAGVARYRKIEARKHREGGGG